MMLTQEIINDLDPGIKNFVIWLNEVGFETTDSGDGISKFLKNQADGNLPLDPDGSILEYPHVFIAFKNISGSSLSLICDELCSIFEDQVDHKNWNIEISYSSKDKIWIMAITGILDRDIKKFQISKIEKQILSDLREKDRSDGYGLDFLEMRLKKLQGLEQEKIKDDLVRLSFYLDAQKEK